MAGFQTKTFIKHDDYMTPFTAWKNIEHLIPKNKVIWEAFYGDGASGQYLTDLGFNVIHEPVDFFKNDLGEIIVSNPPYSQSKEVLERLIELGKPFIILFPLSKINTQYFRKLFSQNPDKIQIIIPRKRIQYEKHIDGKVPEGWKSDCNFDCLYYCWKIGLERDIIWLE